MHVHSHFFIYCKIWPVFNLLNKKQEEVNVISWCFCVAFYTTAPHSVKSCVWENVSTWNFQHCSHFHKASKVPHKLHSLSCALLFLLKHAKGSVICFAAVYWNNFFQSCTVITNYIHGICLMNTMHGALMSFFLSCCLCYVHVLASFVHITKANVKGFFF